VTDSRSCFATDTVNIEEPEPLRINREITRPYCVDARNGQIELQVDGGVALSSGTRDYNYKWSNENTNSMLLDVSPGYYKVTVTDANGCMDTMSIQLNPKQKRCFKIPTAFSPNGDGVNDVWRLEGLHTYYNKVEIEVYDRWGTLVFSSKGYEQPWDGTYKGKPLPVDSYHFIIRLNGGERTLTGQVTIVK
jgi:gliding motility-associated-like protein